MTVPYGMYADEGENVDDQTYDPILVQVAGTPQRQNAPDFGNAANFTVPVFVTGGSGPPPVQLLQRRVMREQAYIRNNDPANSIIVAENIGKAQFGIGFTIGPLATQKIEAQEPFYGVANNVAGTSPVTLSTNGSAAVAAGGVVIATLALPAGTWSINWSMLLAGTTSGADDNNAQLMIGATVIMISLNGTTINTTYPQLPATIIVPAGGATLTVQSITGGSGTATYKALVAASPVGASGLVPAPASVSVLDEAWLAMPQTEEAPGQ